MVKRLLIPILALMSALPMPADTDTRQQIFSPRFKTLKVQNMDIFDAPPVMRLGSEDRLEITFDEIGDDNSFLEYRLLHCNADWQPSSLLDSEFLAGFNAVRIEDYAFSTATFVHYVNYRIEIPNEETGILRSGNYLLQVYNPDEPDETLLQARFRVSENSATIVSGYNARTDLGFNDSWQQVWATATVELGDGSNPYNDYRLEVTQNNDDRTRRTLPVPSRVNGNQLVYDHNPQLIFPAGNEYLRFESLSNQFAGMKVDSLRYEGTNYHVWLKPDYPRAEREYQFDRTQHGRFIVREYNSTDSNIGADYITVHFLLEMDRLPGAEIYVDGEMTNGLLTDRNRMEYDGTKGVYTLQLPLKQGAYNYRYLVKDLDGKVKSLDGDKWETGNQYEVSLWKRRPGDRADSLIGVELIQ
jgi:hypothetical protein